MLLKREDAVRGIHRWYRVSIGPTLLDEWAVCLAWGNRRTSWSRERLLPCRSREEAEALAKRIVAKKERRGYRRVNLIHPES